MIPQADNDFSAVVVAVLGMMVLAVAVVLATSSHASHRLRAALLSVPGLALATILVTWALVRASGFVEF